MKYALLVVLALFSLYTVAEESVGGINRATDPDEPVDAEGWFDNQKERVKHLENYYSSLGIGWSELSPDTGASFWTVDKGRDFAWRILGGYQVDEDWNLELGYSHMGKAELKPYGYVRYSTFTLGPSYRAFEMDFKEKPLAIHLKGGISHLKNSSNVAYKRQHSEQFFYGGYVTYPWKDNWQWRADVETHDFDSSLFLVSLVYHFDKKPEPAPEPAPEPEPEPEPVPVVAEVVVEVDHDLDKDGVLNEVDKCPDTPPNILVDADGCPISFSAVGFATGSAELTDASKEILDKVVVIMVNYPQIVLEIQAHTDSVGSEESNLKLSGKRADSVVAYLVEQGINEERLLGTGYGEGSPIADNATPEGRAKNRRVEFHRIDDVVSAPLEESVDQVEAPADGDATEAVEEAAEPQE